MTNLNHTPGPWGRNIRPARKYPCIYARRNTHVAYVAVDQSLSDDEIEANCNLIASAPETAAERDKLREINADMLAALEALLVRVESLSWLAKSQEIAKARAAIAKARGE